MKYKKVVSAICWDIGVVFSYTVFATFVTLNTETTVLCKP